MTGGASGPPPATPGPPSGTPQPYGRIATILCLIMVGIYVSPLWFSLSTWGGTFDWGYFFFLAEVDRTRGHHARGRNRFPTRSRPLRYSAGPNSRAIIRWARAAGEPERA